MPRVPGDVIVLPQAGGRWVVLNVFARTALGVDTEALRVLRAAEGPVAEAPSGEPSRVWRIGRFSNVDGLLADPSGFARDPQAWGEPERLEPAELVALFEREHLLVDDEDAYRARFAPKQSLLDREHFGNFHQRLGQELIVGRREDPAAWWVAQKFTPDGTEVLDNLYGAVQASFLDGYFPRRFSASDEVVDLGCGTGFYSDRIAATGASVLGLDPSPEYVGLARERGRHGARFEVADVGVPGGLDAIPDASADYVFMSDALLFYFVSPVPGEQYDPQVLLRDVRRILRPGGRFISMEPHYTFWTQPWLGDEDRPFTILTEYAEKRFGVTPSVAQLLQTYARGGFAVAWMEELVPAPAFEQVDPRAYHFAKQFPVWQLYELTPSAGAPAEAP